MAKGKMVRIYSPWRQEKIKQAAKEDKIKLVKDEPKITGKDK